MPRASTTSLDWTGIEHPSDSSTVPSPMLQGREKTRRDEPWMSDEIMEDGHWQLEYGSPS